MEQIKQEGLLGRRYYRVTEGGRWHPFSGDRETSWNRWHWSWAWLKALQEGNSMSEHVLVGLPRVVGFGVLSDRCGCEKSKRSRHRQASL